MFEYILVSFSSFQVCLQREKAQPETISPSFGLFFGCAQLEYLHLQLLLNQEEKVETKRTVLKKMIASPHDDCKCKVIQSSAFFAIGGQLTRVTA